MSIQTAAPQPVSDSAGLGWHLGICTSGKSPGDKAAAGLWITLGDALSQYIPQQKDSQEGF